MSSLNPTQNTEAPHIIPIAAIFVIKPSIGTVPFGRNIADPMVKQKTEWNSRAIIAPTQVFAFVNSEIPYRPVEEAFCTIECRSNLGKMKRCFDSDISSS